MSSDLVLNALPLSHAVGLTTATLMPLLLGARVLLYSSPLHYHIIPELAYERRATVLFGTNTFLMGYGHYADPYDFCSMRLVIADAEPLHENTRQLWAEKFGIRISEAYSLTEASALVAINSRRHHRSGTVGKLAPGLKYYLEPITNLAAGGLLCIRGANIMAGYLRPDLPGHIIPPQAERGPGWHNTGDLVCIDNDGFMTLLGRARPWVQRGGEMVSLTTIE